MKNRLSKNIEKLEALMKQRQSLVIDFLKHVVLVSSTLLAVLAALGEPSGHNKIYFQATLFLLLSSILSGSIAFYIALIQIRTLSKDYGEYVSKLVRNPDHPFQGLFSKYNNLALWLERISILSFLAAVIMLVVYSFS